MDHGFLAAAAEVLHVAHPNLSVAIRQFEDEWGVILFDRVARRLVLTETVPLDDGSGIRRVSDGLSAPGGILEGIERYFEIPAPIILRFRQPPAGDVDLQC